MNKDIDKARMELWAQAWCAVAASSNVTEPKVCTSWADKALEAFDSRFPHESQQ